MVAAEVFQRLGIDDGARGRTQHAFDDGFRVGTGDGAHAVEAHREAALEQGADGVEVEQARHQLGVVGHRVDHLDAHAVERGGADVVQVRPGRRR
jgi:hypothetical protein